MIRGIGVDSVCISEIERLLRDAPAFKRRTYTSAEREAAPEGKAATEYFAVRFAAKEAVFKAVGHLTPSRTFDFRMVETLSEADGCPYVHITPELADILEQADVEKLHISATTENDTATVFVVAEKNEC